MSRLSEFLLQCSGVDREVLRECPTDENKYIGIGGTVLFTGILAFFSSAYAVYTVFDSYFMAVIFGMIWGLMIFNLDRYIVSSMKSQGSFFRDFMVAFPRLVMAVLLALVISKPLELKIFEKEINAELITMEQEVFQEQEDQVWARYSPQIVAHKADIPLLQAEIDQATALRDTLAMMAIQEADGTGGSGQKNLGPIYRTKKAQADKAQSDLEAVEARVLPLIAEKQEIINELEQQAEADIAALDRQAYGGMAARMDALHRLGQDSPAIFYASIFITLLFIALETAPVFVKLISSRSPYDYVLHEREHVFAMNHQERTALLSNTVKNKIKFETESSIYRTQQELEAERELTDEHLKRKKAALAENALYLDPPYIRGNLT